MGKLSFFAAVGNRAADDAAAARQREAEIVAYASVLASVLARGAVSTKGKEDAGLAAAAAAAEAAAFEAEEAVAGVRETEKAAEAAAKAAKKAAERQATLAKFEEEGVSGPTPRAHDAQTPVACGGARRAPEIAALRARHR